MAPPRKTKNGKDIGTRVDSTRVTQAKRHLARCQRANGRAGVHGSAGLHDPPCDGLSDVWRHWIDVGAKAAAAK